MDISAIDIDLLKFIHFHLKNEIFDVILPLARTKTTWIPLYFILLFYLYKNYPKEYWKIILATIVLVIIGDTLCARLLKPLFERARPCQVYELESWFSSFGLCSSTFSFPSCHAVNHSIIAVFNLPYFKNTYKFLLVLWVLLIGFSQIYIGVHYPSDIFGGIIIGSLIGLLGRWGYKRMRKMQSA